MALKSDPKKFWAKGGWKFYAELQDNIGDDSEEASDFEINPSGVAEPTKELKTKENDS